MEQKNDGGYAFPRKVSDIQERMGANAKGMTLRDYFAAQAITGLITGAMQDGSFGNTSPDDFSVAAFVIADSMLKERAK